MFYFFCSKLFRRKHEIIRRTYIKKTEMSWDEYPQGRFFWTQGPRKRSVSFIKLKDAGLTVRPLKLRNSSYGATMNEAGFWQQKLHSFAQTSDQYGSRACFNTRSQKFDDFLANGRALDPDHRNVGVSVVSRYRYRSFKMPKVIRPPSCFTCLLHRFWSRSAALRRQRIKTRRKPFRQPHLHLLAGVFASI